MTRRALFPCAFILFLWGTGHGAKNTVGETENLFKTVNRYRDLAISPDGRTIYLVTANDGQTTDSSGAPTRSLASPGSILAFPCDGRP